MSGNYTLFSFVLFTFFYFFGGQGPGKGVAQCGIEITYWDVIGEFERNDSIFKKVKIQLKNPGFSRYFYLIDNEQFTGPGNHEIFPYENDSPEIDRKSTRLNSSHVAISYAVFCLKKKTMYKL